MGFFYDMKTCTRCKAEKEFTEFNKDKTRHDGLFPQCIECKKNNYKENYLKTRDDKIKKAREWVLNNKEKRKEYRKVYNIKNKELNNKSCREWYSVNKQKVNEYYKKRKENDPLFKLRCNIATLIRFYIKKQGYSKKSKTLKILGCTIEEFKVHLENKFIDGMTWDNHGEWHLDHIYPVSLAKDEEELIKLNHYTNFQPLWALDNIRKSNKINN
jgi:hypothetical protein